MDAPCPICGGAGCECVEAAHDYEESADEILQGLRVMPKVHLAHRQQILTDKGPGVEKFWATACKRIFDLDDKGVNVTQDIRGVSCQHCMRSAWFADLEASQYAHEVGGLDAEAR